jgi:hypothetical protein
MNKSVVFILLGLIPLSGCASSEPSYDPVELIEYERCLNTVPPNFTAEIWAFEGIAEEYCLNKKPILK